jgi:hypothetical protein
LRDPSLMADWTIASAASMTWTPIIHSRAALDTAQPWSSSYSESGIPVAPFPRTKDGGSLPSQRTRRASLNGDDSGLSPCFSQASGLVPI